VSSAPSAFAPASNPAHRASDVPALMLDDLHKRFGKTQIIRGITLSVPVGERHAIIGPNGAGKSTLFNLISGRFAPSSGRIVLGGTDITGCKPYQINRLGLSRSFQITNLFHRLTVFENLRCAVLWSLGYRYSFWQRLNGLADVEQRAEEILLRIGLKRRRKTLAGLLTYAEQRALEIGITIAGGAHTILLDEPTAGMSRSETAAGVALIKDVTQGKTLLMVEHDMSVVFGLADRISVVVYGQVIATGTPAEIRASAQVKEAYLGQHADAAA
jgi:branched-chain amino acid transport system ATP-binding protein